MIPIDMNGKSVLITGGTKGIGLAAGLAFARAGANIYLTSKWSSADAGALLQRFEEAGARPPTLLQADASVEEDTAKALGEIRARENRLDVFVSNVGFAQRVASLDDYKKRSLYKTFDYSSWPLIDYTRSIRAIFGRYPAYVVGVSSDGPDHFYPGYDFVAASKALLEVFARYLAAQTFDDDCRVNVIRFGPVRTESFEAFFDGRFFDHLQETVPAHRMLSLDECGRAVLALCSGLLDGLHGQVITVNHGLSFMDNSLKQFMSQASMGKATPGRTSHDKG